MNTVPLVPFRHPPHRERPADLGSRSRLSTSILHSPFSSLPRPMVTADEAPATSSASTEWHPHVADSKSRLGAAGHRSLHVMGVCGTCFLTLRKTARGRHTWRCHEQAPALLQIPLASRCDHYHCASFRLGNRCPRDLLARVLMDGCARPSSRTW